MMNLYILQKHPANTGEWIAQVDGKWACTSCYLGYWIGGFSTEADARLVMNAFEKAEDDASDAASYS